ncbi:MAG: motility associated factor glycosyltransferase family protein [Peptostreptococcaceae bacterium]
MSNYNKVKSNDNYDMYQIKKDDKIVYLGNKKNYKQTIDDLIDTVDDIYFDSIVFVFGIDSGEYIKSLKSNICSYNKVIIIEPNKDIYLLNRYKVFGNNIELVLFEEEKIKEIINSTILINHVNRLFVHSFGNYKEIYSEEYSKFIEILDRRYNLITSSLNVNQRYKTLFFKDMLANLPVINNSTPLNSNIDINKNKPAIIVSAGPSLDKNIQTMIKHKDKLKNFFIIANNRTMSALIDNDIKPNLVVSVDPLDDIYIMMKKYLNQEVPLAFYEYSNKDLIKEYKGEKIYIAQLLPKIINRIKDISGTFTGGSVAHTCIDIANIIGCSPIILIGQDCANTFGKYHSDNATFDVDKDYKKIMTFTAKNVYGEDIQTTPTLDYFKTKIEEYIKAVQEFKEVEFINCSYGADIIGAPHKELEDVFTSNKYTENINYIRIDKCINIDVEEIKITVLNHIDEYIEKSDKCINICKELLEKETKESLLDMDDDDVNLQQFIYTQQVVDEFEFSNISNYLGGYRAMFLYEIREKYFTMSASDYERLTSNLKYHCGNFLNYFMELKKMLEELKRLYFEVISKKN